MQGYDRSDFRQRDVDLDEYEEDEELEEDGAEYKEKEDPKPTKEELEYLELRQRLKEKARQRMKKESAAAFGNSQERKKKPPNDNYGSFFGPSQPVIAKRVLEERRSILQTQHITAKVPNSHSSNKMGPVSATTVAKPNVHEQPRKAVNEIKKKAQTLKDMRDYSFLLSDDAELPAPAMETAPRKASVPSSDARPTHVPLKSKPPMSKPLMSKPPRPVSNGHLGRNSISSNRQMQTKLGHQKVASASRSGLSSADPRKLPASNAGNGPGRPMGLKAPLPRAPVSSVVKKTSSVGIHSSVQKAPSSKPISTAQKQYSEQKREPLGLDKHKGMPTRPLSSSKPPDYASSSKPQLKTPKQIPSRTVQENRPKKKQPVNRYSDEDDDNEGDGASISRMIRNMFRYNPNKFAGDDEDLSDMEANFADIQREEKRSARIAREEDERELRLIEEEEKEERLRAKRRKLAQR
ncbi:uncharacterized protein LOC143854275 isoform X1 [Tasmannia lanceolata]|uniref:uncharacterized protein LOC143854275 isoform X1 n=1 Tax=Tasmannia lanceolata TaxID=3420 RepID=UPI0040642123